MKAIILAVLCVMLLLSSCRRDEGVVPLGSTGYFVGRWELNTVANSQEIIYNFQEDKNLTLYITDQTKSITQIKATWNLVDNGETMVFSFSGNESYKITNVQRNSFTLVSLTQAQNFKRR